MKFFLFVVIFAVCATIGTVAAGYLLPSSSSIEITSWTIRIIFSVGFSTEQFGHLSAGIDLTTMRIFSLFYALFSVIQVTFILAIVSTILIPPHDLRFVLRAELEIPSNGTVHLEKEIMQQHSPLGYIISHKRINQEFLPISSKILQHFKYILRDFGYIDKFGFLTGMLIEALESRQDAQLQRICQDFAQIDCKYDLKGYLEPREIKAYLDGYDGKRQEAISVLQSLLERDNFGNIFYSWTVVPIRSFLLMSGIYTPIGEDPAIRELVFSRRKSKTDFYVASPIGSVEGNDQKILNHCYKLLIDTQGVSKSSRSENEHTLRRLYDKYHHDADFFRRNPNAPLYLISILNNLGIWYYNLKKFHYAEHIFRQCILEYNLSILHHQNHSNLTDTLNIPLQPSNPIKVDVNHIQKEYIYLLYNLGNTLNQLSHFEEAESLYFACLRKLEPVESNIGDQNYEFDPDYLSILSNLGLLYSHQSEYDELAEYLFRECFTKRNELLTLIQSAKVKCEHKIEEPACPRPTSSRFSGRFSPGIFKVEEDIVKSDQSFSLDSNHHDKKILRQYISLEREHTILWIHSGFNLCCFYIERDIYDKENIPEILQECLDKSKILWGETNDMMDRILCVWNKMKIQKIQKLNHPLQGLWSQIYENIPKSNEMSLTATLSNIFSDDLNQHHCYAQRRKFDEEWGDVVMNPEQWIESSTRPAGCSSSKWNESSNSLAMDDE